MVILLNYPDLVQKGGLEEPPPPWECKFCFKLLMPISLQPRIFAPKFVNGSLNMGSSTTLKKIKIKIVKKCAMGLRSPPPLVGLVLKNMLV